MTDLDPSPEVPAPRPRRGFRVTTLMVLVLVAGSLLGLYARDRRRTQEEAWRLRRRALEEDWQLQCTSNLKQIAMALENYHRAFLRFPPPYIADPAGKPMHSWRVLIGPYAETHPDWSTYRYDEPWDGPNNRKLIDRNWPSFYACPGLGAKPGRTSYVMIVGPGTAAPGVKAIRLGDIRDGPGRTILIAEVANVNIPWTEPRDLDAATMSWIVNDPSRPGISSHHGWPKVIFADGKVRWLDPSIPPGTLKAMTTIAGGEPVNLDRSR